MISIDSLDKEEVLVAFQTHTSIEKFARAFGINGSDNARKFVAKVSEKFDIDYRMYYKKRGQLRDEYNLNPNHCKHCGKELDFDHRNNQFCSQSCAATYNNLKRPKKDRPSKENQLRAANVNFEKWLNGENYVIRGFNIPRLVRRYLLNIHNNKCQCCGWGGPHPITGNIPLSIHHIDGDCTNNRINNLQLLCPNCHSLTPNFGNLNKNSKRFHKKKLQ